MINMYLLDIISLSLLLIISPPSLLIIFFSPCCFLPFFIMSCSHVLVPSFSPKYSPALFNFPRRWNLPIYSNNKGHILPPFWNVIDCLDHGQTIVYCRLNRILETKEEQVLALSFEFSTLQIETGKETGKEGQNGEGHAEEQGAGQREYLTPPPCFNTDVVKYREINNR